jgi:hypothetical protein
MTAEQTTPGLWRAVAGLLTLGILVALLLAWRPPAADAETHPCSPLRGISVREIVAQNIGCGEAHRVVRLWRRNCNYAGRCQVENGGLPASDRFTCQGKSVDGRLKMACVNFIDRSEAVRFNAAG